MGSSSRRGGKGAAVTPGHLQPSPPGAAAAALPSPTSCHPRRPRRRAELAHSLEKGRDPRRGTAALRAPHDHAGGCGAGRVCWRLARGSAALPCPALHRTAAPACSHTQGRDTAICRHPNQHTNLIPRAAYCRNRSEGEAWAVPAGDCREPRSAPGLSQRSTGKQGQSYEEKIRVSSSSDLVITQSNTTSATEKCSWPRKFKHVYNFIHICKCTHV